MCPVSCGSPVLSIAFQDNMIAAGCQNGKIKLFALTQPGDWRNIQSESSLSCSSTVFSIAFKDNTIAAGCMNGAINLFALTQSGEWGEMQPQSPLTGHSDTVTGVTFSADGQWLISGSIDRTIRLWNAHAGGTVVSAV